tara:strand:+ start:3559 stop:5001 length:1443 start_codon:yes stop_codon:yes gene_type:complete
MGVIDGTDVIDVEQRGKWRQVKARYDAWKKKWEQGTEWGIVGGSPLKNLPDTVLDQALEHGNATYARDRARTIEGLGDLIEAVSEIIDGDAILTKHREDLEDSINQMMAVLKVKKWNPRNIPFHTVIEFTEGGEGEEPTVKRGKVYGHYRTEAYNQYVEWAMENKENFKGKLANTDTSWYNKKTGTAKPPLWLAITGEESDGMLSIARAALEACKKIKIKGPVQFGIFNNRGPEILAQIPSVQEHVRTVVQMPEIYPRGKSRAPVKDRLNAAFVNHIFDIENEDQARLFSQFIKGWDTVEGLEKVKQVRLRFPKNNLALNKLIRIVMGDDMDTFQKPGSSNNKDDANYAPAGLMLKSQDWKNVLKSDDVNKFFRRKEQPAQFTADGLKFSDQNTLNKFNEYKNALGRAYGIGFTRALKEYGDVFLGINQINSEYQKRAQMKRQGDQEAELSRQRMNQQSSTHRFDPTDPLRRPDGGRWRG